jgi:hypothetical protein
MMMMMVQEGKKINVFFVQRNLNIVIFVSSSKKIYKHMINILILGEEQFFAKTNANSYLTLFA